MYLRNLALATLALLPFTAARAQTSIVSANRFTGGLILQDTNYRIDNYFNYNNSIDVDGQFLFGGYKAAINPRFSIGGGIGLMIDGDIGNNNQVGGGDGFRLFGDLQYEVHRFNLNKVLLTGTLSHDRFSFSESNIDIDFTMTELKIGALIMRDVRDFSLYGGLEVVAFSNGEFKQGNFSGDAKRDDRLNIRLGAAFNASPNFGLRADLLLVGEQTITLAADFAL